MQHTLPPRDIKRTHNMATLTLPKDSGTTSCWYECGVHSKRRTDWLEDDAVQQNRCFCPFAQAEKTTSVLAVQQNPRNERCNQFFKVAYCYQWLVDVLDH